MLVAVLGWVLLALVMGSGVFCVLALVAVRDYLRQPVPRLPDPAPAISVLKPLAGADEGLADNLRSFFQQEYQSNWEILAAVRTESDPAAAVFLQIAKENPNVVARLLVVGEPSYANAKVHSLEQMTAAARHDVLAMSDSDIRVTSNFLQSTAAEIAPGKVGVVTCPYRAVAGRSLPSRLEAAGMNTEFLAGVLTARLLEGMKFALGPTIVARKAAIAAAGGWTELAEFLAEDFVLGNRAAERGWTVVLSRYVVEHRIGSQSWSENARHRLRWARSTRRSRPGGYVGQLFTNPLPLILLLVIVWPAVWPVCLPVLVLRAAAAWATAGPVLRSQDGLRLILLTPLQDLVSFLFWISGFFGTTISWRGRRYLLLSDGRFRLLT